MSDEQYQVRCSTSKAEPFEVGRTRTRSEIAHPSDIAPSPGELKAAYQSAVEEIGRRRGIPPPQSGYATEVQEQAYSTFYGAFADACVAIVCNHYPSSGYAKDHKPRRDMHVIASAPGSGKSTLAKAFAIALARVGESRPYPLGCVFLVHHIATAEIVYRELSALCPGKIAVFSTKHDAESTQPKRYAGLFRVNDLHQYPIIVVTHEFYMGIRGEHARLCTKGDLKFPRVVTFIDERANEIAVHDLDPWGLEGVLEHVRGDNYAPPELRDSMTALERFVSTRRYGQQKIETARDDKEGWAATANSLAYFRNDDAARYMRAASARNPRLDFDDVFGFANALLEERAFISRHRGIRTAHFVGYERALPRIAGMVLLDATADIDGVTAICPWRKHAETPKERYDRLEVVHVPSVARGNIHRWFREPGNIQVYADRLRDLILRYADAGQKVLVVCPKAVVFAQNVDSWSKHMEPFLNRTAPEYTVVSTGETEFRENFAWSLDGRQVVLTWFGGYGIGANVWREADVVIVCDDFYLPQRTVKATFQGLRGHKATEGYLAETPEDWTDELATLMDGHILRWMKQMALRGKAREMDENGICGPQRLVITGDLIRLLGHRPEVFPGAKIKVEHPNYNQLLDRLIALLLSTEESELSTKEIEAKLDRKWSDISGNLKRQKAFEAALEAIGWSYHRGKGQKRGCFRRIETEKISTQEQSVAEQGPSSEYDF